MVAEVIKLPSVATNNFQSKQISRSSLVVNTSAQAVQQDNVRAREQAAKAAESIEVISDAAKVLNEFAEKIKTNLSFSIDEASGRTVITVTDTQTGDVIRQIPAKEVLAVANLIREVSATDIEKVGLLLADQG